MTHNNNSVRLSDFMNVKREKQWTEKYRKYAIVLDGWIIKWNYICKECMSVTFAYMPLKYV